jgi:hypothetical protein
MFEREQAGHHAERAYDELIDIFDSGQRRESLGDRRNWAQDRVVAARHSHGLPTLSPIGVSPHLGGKRRKLTCDSF